jgi:hypothetical protein
MNIYRNIRKMNKTVKTDWSSDFSISCIDMNIRKAVNLLDNIKKWPTSTYNDDRRLIIEELMDYLLQYYWPDLNYVKVKDFVELDIFNN